MKQDNTREPFNKEKAIEIINKAIQDCEWRKEQMEISMCSGLAAPCQKMIENGKCPTLKQLFKEKKTREELNL